MRKKVREKVLEKAMEGNDLCRHAGDRDTHREH